MAAIRPYGDATDDGMVQLSFTLPLETSDLARRAALDLVRNMGIERPHVVHMKPVGDGFTFFILYGATVHAVDPAALPPEARDFPLLSPEEVDDAVLRRLGRPLVVVGACTGNDAHTVGLDAILSLKGFGGDKGLEHLSAMRIVNLGAQVDPADIVEAVAREAADAVLISQVVTQRDAHILHLSQVREALEEAGLRARVVLVGGGPRLSPEQAHDLGYDRIFGRGTRPSEVASYLAWATAAKRSTTTRRQVS